MTDVDPNLLINQGPSLPEGIRLNLPDDLERVVRSAPYVVYGKLSPAVNINPDKPWQPTDAQLASLLLFARNQQELTLSNNSPVGGDFGYQIRAVRGNNMKIGDHRSPDLYSIFLSEQHGKGKEPIARNSGDDITRFGQGNQDLLVLEPDSLLYAFTPPWQISQQRGKLQFEFKLFLDPSKLEALYQEIKKSSDLPFRLLQALFPSAFNPSVTDEQLIAAWQCKELAALRSLGNCKDLSEQISLSPAGVTGPQSAFKILTRDYLGKMVEDALKATKLARRAPLTHLTIMDTRVKKDLSQASLEVVPLVTEV
jgi:hypothetical protein